MAGDRGKIIEGKIILEPMSGFFADNHDSVNATEQADKSHDASNKKQNADVHSGNDVAEDV